MVRSGKRPRTGPSNTVEDYSIYLKDPNTLEQFKEFQTFEILPGRFVKFDDFLPHNFSSYFENNGLLELFSSDNRRPCYPLLVQLFYTNITLVKTLRGTEKLHTLVKGIEIELTVKQLGRLLNIPYTGISLDDVRIEDQNVLSNKIFLPGLGLPLNHSNKLRPIPRFIARILAYNLFPKTGSFHFISLDLAKALYAIMANIKVNWAEVYYHTLSVLPRGFLPFGAFLTHIFEKFNVDVESENSVVRSVEFFDTNALTRMKLTNFVLPENQPNEPQIPTQEPPPTKDIPQSSTQAGPSSSYIPEPSCFTDAQYNTLSARILNVETSQNLLFDQNIAIMNNQREFLENQQVMMRMFEDLTTKFDSYFHGYQPPHGPSE